jgi:hypothetical protein
MIGIIARLACSHSCLNFRKLFGDSQLLLFFIELAFFFVIVMATVWSYRVCGAFRFSLPNGWLVVRAVRYHSPAPAITCP